MEKVDTKGIPIRECVHCGERLIPRVVGLTVSFKMQGDVNGGLDEKEYKKIINTEHKYEAWKKSNHINTILVCPGNEKRQCGYAENMVQRK